MMVDHKRRGSEVIVGDLGRLDGGAAVQLEGFFERLGPADRDAGPDHTTDVPGVGPPGERRWVVGFDPAAVQVVGIHVRQQDVGDVVGRDAERREARRGLPR